MKWPVLTPARSHEWTRDCADAANTAERLASRVTTYAGGGAPAHKLREAAKLIDEARQEILRLAVDDVAMES